MLEADEADRRDSVRRNVASLRMQIGQASFETHTEMTPQGLLAIGGMVSLILLSVVPIIWVSTRKLPHGAMPRGMRRSRL